MITANKNAAPSEAAQLSAASGAIMDDLMRINGAGKVVV